MPNISWLHRSNVLVRGPNKPAPFVPTAILTATVPAVPVATSAPLVTASAGTGVVVGTPAALRVYIHTGKIIAASPPVTAGVPAPLAVAVTAPTVVGAADTSEVGIPAPVVVATSAPTVSGVQQIGTLEATVDPVAVATSVPSITITTDATTIDTAWLADTMNQWNGAAPNGPWKLLGNTTYNTGVAVTATGAGFAFMGDNTVINVLHNLTFGNHSIANVTNGNFDTGDATGWTLSAGCTVRAASYVDPVERANGTHSCRVTVAGGATETMTTSQSFSVTTEKGAAVCFWHNNNTSGLNISASIGSLSSGTKKFNKLGTACVWYMEPGDTADSGPLVITIENTTGGALTVDIDAVQFLPARQHGLFVAHPDETWTPGTVGTSARTNITINIASGVSITEGQAQWDSCGVGGRSGFVGLTVNGPGTIATHAGSVQSQLGGPFTTDFCTGPIVGAGGLTLESNALLIENRETFHGYAGKFFSTLGSVSMTEVHVTNSCQGGLVPRIQSTPVTNTITVDDCTIKTRSRYTNGFAILCRGVGSSNTGAHSIQGNTFDHSGDATLGGRGLSLDGMDVGGTLTVDDNTAKVRELELNQEYDGRVTNGAYGVQLEGNARNTALSNNHWEVIGESGQAVRLKPDGGGAHVNVSFANETWIANVDTPGTDLGYVCSMKEMNEADGTTFDNITMTSNSRFFFMDKDNTGTILFTSSTVTRVGTSESFPCYRQSTSAADQSVLPVIELRNTTYADAGSKVFMFDAWPLNLAQSNIIRGTESSTLTFEDGGVAQVGLSITVDDSAASVVLTGTTDGFGQVSGTVQYRERETTRNSSTTLFNSDDHDVDWGSGNQSWELSDDAAAGFNNTPTFAI